MTRSEMPYWTDVTSQWRERAEAAERERDEARARIEDLEQIKPAYDAMCRALEEVQGVEWNEGGPYWEDAIRLLAYQREHARDERDEARAERDDAVRRMSDWAHQAGRLRGELEVAVALLRRIKLTLEEEGKCLNDHQRWLAQDIAALLAGKEPQP